jgi:hypothetical protein
MRLDNPARPGLQQQSADVGAQLAQVEGKIAEVQARLAQAQNVSVDRISSTGTLLPPFQPRDSRRGPDPDMVVGMSFVLGMCLVLPLSVAFARRLWRGKPQVPTAPFDDIVQRLSRMEVGMDAMAIEIERVSEGQRFVTKILADRPAQSAHAQNAQQAALGEGQQPLRALGAGPMEPVRVSEAEALKQRVR